MIFAAFSPRRFLPCLLLALATPLAASEIDLRAPDEIVALLSPFLPERTDDRRRLEQTLGDILATEGYFSPQFEYSEPDGGVRLTIDPAPRTRIDHVDVSIDGALAPTRRDKLISGWRLPVGQPFRQEDWNAAKQAILADLLADEHPAARLTESAAEIDPEARQASLSAHYDAGPRYRFGPLHINGLQRFSPELIARYNRTVHPGDPYSETRLNALQASLQATPYFASVQTRLDRDAAEADGEDTVTAPVVVEVREREAHRLGFGGGYSSNTGARVEANYHTPDLFNQAWSLDSGLRLEQKKQTLYADTFLPPDEQNRRRSLGTMAEDTNIQGLRTERVAVGGQIIQQRGLLEERLSLNWEFERRQPDGAQPDDSHALVPNVMWTWRHVDNLLDPHDGIVLQAQVGGGARAALSDENFVRLYGRWLQYVPLGRADTLTLRAEAGYTVAESRLHIPQDYLFRTGGTGSVRGYDYQSLGVKEGSAIVGGRYMAVASVEATHWFDAHWGIASFVDAGNAVDALAAYKADVGYGIGGRWRSPAGPIGIDIAHGRESGKTLAHFSLSIPF